MVKKIALYLVGALVIISIFLASYFDKDNNLRDEAIRMGDTFYCKKIEVSFIKKKCFEIVERKLSLLKKCRSENGYNAKECNNLAY
ncbi:hypothetical protein [Halobacteriovorax sp. JY17]|uniref:hypothetical protein n=1 Tax=Halobacteriovorax sp. JY17 TaxID=2014617 RepID=UPI000C483E72|nr:hypothetical protein [Halobacteriovorax sp. JY17]PIK15720.1 MAG: hypothetical protein CES88_03045 [Halobacteriovorax sp. JY17]